jgi:CheY-like chemotaxis protein
MARILVADDDSTAIEVLSVALSAVGHEVIQASDGLAAYEATLEQQPRLVFLDVMMPVFDGYETCQRLRADPDVPADLPIIFLTSLDPDRRRIAEAGATDYLSKRHMVSGLQDLLARHLGPDAVG